MDNFEPRDHRSRLLIIALLVIDQCIRPPFTHGNRPPIKFWTHAYSLFQSYNGLWKLSFPNFSIYSPHKNKREERHTHSQLAACSRMLFTASQKKPWGATWKISFLLTGPNRILDLAKTGWGSTKTVRKVIPSPQMLNRPPTSLYWGKAGLALGAPRFVFREPCSRNWLEGRSFVVQPWKRKRTPGVPARKSQLCSAAVVKKTYCLLELRLESRNFVVQP